MSKQQIIEYWNQLEANYKNKKFTKNQKKILEIAKDFYDGLREAYTGYGLSHEKQTQKLRELREVKELYSGNKRL